MSKALISLIVFLTIAFGAHSQSFYFGVKGGPTIGFQKWNGYERDPLTRFHAIAFIETASEENVALFAQAGYHVKGSSIRVRRYFSNFLGRDVSGFSTPFEFKNLSLTLGAKQRFDLGIRNKVYYLFGIRGDYTLDTNLRPEGISEEDPCFISYPFEEFVNDFNYGFTAGGGIEFPFSEFVTGLLEFTINPDISKQYNQPEIPNIQSCGGITGGNRTLNERQITNTTFEVTLGLRFLRKVEYID